MICVDCSGVCQRHKMDTKSDMESELSCGGQPPLEKASEGSAELEVEL